MMRKIFPLIILLLCLASFVRSQDIAVKTNLFYGAYTQTPNLGFEVKMSNHLTLDVSAGYNWFGANKDFTDDYKKKAHWLVQPELRYWLCEDFNGHFFGVHLLGAQYNISQHKLPLLFGSDSKEYRFEGWAMGAGLSYGYHLPLSRRWGMEFSLGVGYAYMKYDRYDCYKCGEKFRSGEVKHYFGPTKATVGLIYIIN